MRDRFATTPDGRIHYLQEGSGPPLVLLHSVGCSAYEYEDSLPLLAQHFTVYAWDMPGHGDSDPLPRHYTIEDFARAVVHLMDAAGLARATVVGESIGGVICAALALHHRDRLEKLVFCESPLRTAEEWAQAWLTVEGNFGIPTQTMEQVAARLRHVTPQFLQRWNIDRNKAGAHHMVDAMWAIREFDMYAALPRVDVPSLVIFGERGPFVPVGKHEEFMRLLRNAELVVLKDCGHFPMNDDPEGFAQAVIRFARQTVTA